VNAYPAPESLGAGALEAAEEDQRLAVGVRELAQDAAALQAEGVNMAVAEVAHQQGAAELAEALARQGGVGLTGYKEESERS
jgi:hypothetical protein